MKCERLKKIVKNLPMHTPITATYRGINGIIIKDIYEHIYFLNNILQGARSIDPELKEYKFSGSWSLGSLNSFFILAVNASSLEIYNIKNIKLI